MSEPTAILVLGMHRSGTSALAGVLHLLGAGMPDDLMPGDQYNEKGYWESKEVADFNDEILTSAGSRWDKIAKFPQDWFQKPIAAEFRARAIELLKKHYRSSDLFVLKDPRISLLVPFWISVVEEMGIRPVFAIASRNPREVAASLARRDGFPPEKSELLWLIHLLAAEKSTRGRPRCVVDYEQLLDNWRACAGRIEKILGRPWPVPIESAAGKIDAMLNGDLRHHQAADDEIAKSSPWVSRAFEAIQAAAAGNESQLSQTLDDIDKTFDVALTAFGPLIIRPAEPDKNSQHRLLVLDLERVERENRESAAERAALARIAGGAAGACVVGLDHLVAVSGVSRASDGSWHGKAGSPRFLAAVTLPAGKARIRATIRSSVWSRAVIWLDCGRGFIDCDGVELAPLFPGENRIERVITVYRSASLMRFDPAQNPGEFALLTFVLEPVPASYEENKTASPPANMGWGRKIKRLFLPA
jgi:hypothetical protein